MKYNFNTDDERRGRAALILYAMYKSRSANSPMNGKETWDRVGAYIRSAVVKSTTMGEFVQNFCKLGHIPSVIPRYLTTGAVKVEPGVLISTGDVKDYRLDVMDDDSLLDVFDRESLLVVMLVRERIQREKLNAQSAEPDAADWDEPAELITEDEITEVTDLED